MDETSKTAKFEKVTVDAGDLKILEAVRDKSRKSFQNGAAMLVENISKYLLRGGTKNGLHRAGDVVEAMCTELRILGVPADVIQKIKEPK